MSTLKICETRCEYRKNPIGIDVLRPRFSWKIKSDRRNTMQSAYQLQSAWDESFSNNIWDTGRVGTDRSTHIEYDGPDLKPRTRYYYRVRVWDTKGNASDWSETAFWETGQLGAEEWRASWIVPDTKVEALNGDACPILRKAFNIDGKVKTARIYATSLGLYELCLNGRRVGDWLLTPGWTSYSKRLQYQTYDVKDLLINGENAVGAVLGKGWYSGSLAWSGNKGIYGNSRALLLQMHITYEDGREETILSDEGWKASTGPILISEIYHGETYDARLEQDNWSIPGYDDSSWQAVTVLNHEKNILVGQENVPTRAIQEIKPTGLITTPAGETVIDMGQNMVGWVRFKVHGKAGDEVVLKHAEVLDRDGNFYTENLRAAKQTIKYILRGGKEEIFEPHFTFQGFRYIKVEKYPEEVSLDDFTGVVIHSDMEQTGSFECSEELVNKLQHNILWGQKGNFVDVPTDCPQRDERLGWTGDAQVFMRTACFNMNVAPFFSKWLKDLAADQLESGGIPFVIPNVFDNKSHSSSGWGDAATICPWTLYLCYGDERILEEQYGSMKAWVEYIRNQGENEYLWNTGFHFGDWLGLDAKEGSYKGATAEDFIATAFYAHSTGLLVKAAKVLGKNDDVREYSRLYDNIIQNFRKEFVTPGGRLAVPTQTAHVLALMFNLIEEKDRERTINTLAKLIEDNKDHLTTGFIGTPYLCHVLTQNGRNDLAYKLVMQEDYPSWLYPITKGATTIWEHWDGIKEDGSFWSPDMNSFNHYAYGSIGDWLYRVTAGLDTDEAKPGYKHIYIRPLPGGKLTYVKASFESVYGEIKSAWRINGSQMEVEVCIPANTTATLVLPFANLRTVNEGGVPATEAEGIAEAVQTEAGVRLELGSGEYKFKYTY